MGAFAELIHLDQQKVREDQSHQRQARMDKHLRSLVLRIQLDRCLEASRAVLRRITLQSEHVASRVGAKQFKRVIDLSTHGKDQFA